jgi:hypothetical protein
MNLSRPYLVAAWGYTVGIAYMSFFGQLKASNLPIRPTSRATWFLPSRVSGWLSLRRASRWLGLPKVINGNRHG